MRLSRLLPLLALVACSPGVPGAYALQTVDGEPLPMEFFDDQITAVRLDLNEDGTCHMEASWASADPSELYEGCSWTLEEGAVTVVTTDVDPLSGTAEDGELRLTDSTGSTLVFAKE